MYEKEISSRFCQSHFSHIDKSSNKIYFRNWLIYSESKGRFFKIIDSDTNQSVRFTKDGFNDWKNASNLLKRHQESTPHRKAIISLLNSKNMNACLVFHL